MSGQFESLRASELYCRRCGRSMPVRERLLLVVPGREIYDYLCTGCAESLGRREVAAGGPPRVPPSGRAPRRRLSSAR